MEKPRVGSATDTTDVRAPLTRSGELRRRTLGVIASFAATAYLSPRALAQGSAPPILQRAIPSSGEQLPLVGLGSWITFNVGDDAAALDRCAEVVRGFLDSGGRLLDSSPMYGSSQATIGYALHKLVYPRSVFCADKVWTPNASDGPAQIAQTSQRWGIARFDLLQVHNLENWQAHLPTLFAMKAADKLRYVGVTTSEERRTGETEQLIQSQRLDFVQVSYNILDRELDQRLLPMARDRGMAVITNRPFQRGALIERFKRHPLPDWAGEIDCRSWPQFLLKFIISHPAVTCAIPATSNPAHVRENMSAAYGRLPDERMRQRMIAYVEAL